MAYLTFEEYQGLGFSKVADEDTFKKIEADVEILFDIPTNSFYRWHDLEKDIPERSQMFKRAIALQIDFSNDVSASTPYELAQQSVTHVSIGRTTVDAGSLKSVTRGNTGLYGVAYSLLAQTGLTYWGRCSC